MQAESISLYQKHGTTDKEYHAQLKTEGSGWVITMQNGRRGGTLTPRRKFEQPVAYEVAKKEYDKLVRSKKSDGYSEGIEGVQFQDVSFEARFTGNVPQLYNEATPKQVIGYLADPEWVLQEKYDGHRRMVQRTGTDVIGSNKKGLQVALPQPVVDCLSYLEDEGDLLLDGELLGGSLVVFDVLIVNGRDIRGLPLEARLVHLERIKAKLEAAGADSLRATSTARTEEEKRMLYALLREKAREGGMFKRLDAPYTAGRPNSGGDQMKNPFIWRATFITGKQKSGKRSVELFGVDGDKTVFLGYCTIPANHAIPPEGAFIDCDYKYVYVDGAVAQARYVRERDDVDRADCAISKLHYKETPFEKDEEDEEQEEALA